MNGWTGVIYWVWFFSIPVAYLTPAIIALARGNRNKGSVVVVDLLLGWTFVGWIVAFAMAFQSQKPVAAMYPPPYNVAVR